MPPVAPPRTSSTHHNPPSRDSSSRRRDHASERATASPRRHQPEPSSYADVNGNDIDYVDAPRSRRAAQHDSANRPASSRDSRPAQQTVIPVRSHAQPQPVASPKQPSREASEVLNRIIVSQPETDLQRERERIAEAQPQALEAAPPPVVGMHPDQDNGQRGARSRHEPSKREKAVKFGDYILGNTIGEGEFGKVKLGWKQAGGVQVGGSHVIPEQRASEADKTCTGCHQTNQTRQRRQQPVSPGQDLPRDRHPARDPAPQHCAPARNGGNRTTHRHHPRVCIRWRTFRLHFEPPVS